MVKPPTSGPAEEGRGGSSYQQLPGGGTEHGFGRVPDGSGKSGPTPRPKILHILDPNHQQRRCLNFIQAVGRTLDRGR